MTEVEEESMDPNTCCTPVYALLLYISPTWLQHWPDEQHMPLPDPQAPPGPAYPLQLPPLGGGVAGGGGEGGVPAGGDAGGGGLLLGEHVAAMVIGRGVAQPPRLYAVQMVCAICWEVGQALDLWIDPVARSMDVQVVQHVDRWARQ